MKAPGPSSPTALSFPCHSLRPHSHSRKTARNTTPAQATARSRSGRAFPTAAQPPSSALSGGQCRPGSECSTKTAGIGGRKVELTSRRPACRACRTFATAQEQGLKDFEVATGWRSSAEGHAGGGRGQAARGFFGGAHSRAYRGQIAGAGGEPVAGDRMPSDRLPAFISSEIAKWQRSSSRPGSASTDCAGGASSGVRACAARRHQ